MRGFLVSAGFLELCRRRCVGGLGVLRWDLQPPARGARRRRRCWELGLKAPTLGALRRLWTVSFMLQPQALWTALPIWTRG